mmetsp:Transcript_20782/g.64936  ORF Transcript_20782/g.64936 Transcript_20782/m.64936 type:complete len:107 (-) Transcript_20782:143-463(-)
MHRCIGLHGAASPRSESQRVTSRSSTGHCAHEVPKRKKYTASGSDCALDFTVASYGEWRQWMDSEYTFSQHGLQAKSVELMTFGDLWGLLIGAIEAKSSVHNLEEQ